MIWNEGRFWDDDELQADTEVWFGDQIAAFYFKSIECSKENRGKYVK